MSDPVAGWKKYGEAANRSIADWTRKKGPPLDYEPREDENFVVYRDAPYRDIVGEYGPDASYVWGKCIRDSIADLMVGDPVMVGQTLDQNILGETSINPRTPGTEAYRAGWLEDVEIREQKKRNCWTQLDKLRSFEIVDGRFDASRSLPGVIIYGRWGIDPFPTSSGNAGPYSALKNKNMIDRYGVMFRLNGKPLKVQPLNEYYIKDKKSGNWYYFESIGPGFFGGGGEGSAVG